MAEKDISVIIRKKRTLLSVKSHFCHTFDTSVTNILMFSKIINSSVKKTVLSLIKTVLSLKFCEHTNFNSIKCLNSTTTRNGVFTKVGIILNSQPYKQFSILKRNFHVK